MISENLSMRLNAIRKSRGLSITDFSRELGIARSSLQALLNGSANPRTDTIEYIARQLEVDPLLLLSSGQTRSRDYVCDRCELSLTPEERWALQQLLQQLQDL